jgi:predicted ferric reductase
VTPSTIRTVAKPAAATAAVGLLAGFGAASWMGAAPVGRMLPWILGRGLGIAAFLSLTALTVLGLWLRHPLAQRWRWPTPTTRIRVHAALAALTLVLVIGHIVALVLDSFAGVGWAGAIVPGRSGFRPFAVGLGTASVYLALLVGATAALAGRFFGRMWRRVHGAALLVFGLAWAHGLLSGSDTPRLRLMYGVTGGVVALLAVTRRLMPAVRRPLAGRTA